MTEEVGQFICTFHVSRWNR